MCMRTKCDECGKPTYAGCGAHVEQVLRDVPPAERCRCREERALPRANTDEPKPTWRDRVFGK